MSCEFCKDKKKITDMYTGAILYMDGDYDGLLRFDNSGNEYAHGSKLINYCPFCGRNLNEDS